MLAQSGSRVPGWSRLSVTEKAQIVAEHAHLRLQDRESLERLMRRKDSPALDIAPNFRVNDKDYFVPGITEEASVWPAASNGARLVWNTGGFTATYTGSKMEGQIQIVGVRRDSKLKEHILEAKDELIRHANTVSSHVVAEDLEVRAVRTGMGRMFSVEFRFDTEDAMGGNRINEMLQLVTPKIKQIVGGDGLVNTRIISNFSADRLVKVEGRVRIEDIGGKEAANRVAYVSELGNHYYKRAATDNKGIMNGVEAILRATDNDTRAEEAAVHSYASHKHPYRSLSKWTVNREGELVGRLAIPAQFGIIGGAIGLYEESRLSKMVLSRNDDDSFHMPEFAAVVGAVALASNLPALWKQTSEEGIQKGHMKEYERQLSELSGS